MDLQTQLESHPPALCRHPAVQHLAWRHRVLRREVSSSC